MSRILVIDDNDTIREGMALAITKMGHEVAICSNGTDGCAAFAKKPFDLVITDLKMVPIDGHEVVRRVKTLDPLATILVITAYGTVESAVEAMKLGATDFIPKPFSPEGLRVKVQQALSIANLQRDCARLQTHNDLLSKPQRGESALLAIQGNSTPMRALFSGLRKVAPTDTTVFIGGESGTGKELVARAIHQLSPRADKPFVSVHCAALVETLLESELFGHEKGAFTGAIKRKLGRFELADGGTIFLDEIGEISPSIQAKLLRVLQQKEIERVGGESIIPIDVRVVSATNRDLAAAVAQGLFREDLYYRLHIVPLLLPPLRERPGDIALLARHFVEKHAPKLNRKVKALSPALLDCLEAYRWPGNVRELENAIEQALVFCESDTLDLADFPALRGAPTAGTSSSAMSASPSGAEALSLPSEDIPLTEALENLERQLILRAFEKAKGVKAEAARLLGIKPTSIYYKLEKYGLIKPDEKSPVIDEHE
ncbi:MAG: sigma-54 dependent transcriptional regulator [Myxococcales bacterium]|jgi:two-component system response regulator HydG|nr:sigma-54 dependent transcriptional regulator [Myxococcales bacterium]